MVKEIFIKSLCILLVVLVISVSCTKTEQTDPLSYARIVNLDRSLLYDQIATEFSSYPWNREEEPRMFMIYCEAIVESRNKLPSFLKYPYFKSLNKKGVYYFSLRYRNFRVQYAGWLLIYKK